jgi:hypothetical protein
MYHSNQSLIGYYLFPDVLNLDYIHTSQLSSIGSNSQARQNFVIRVLETRYMLWPGIENSMYTFHSNSYWIIFIPRRVKARLYI